MKQGKDYHGWAWECQRGLVDFGDIKPDVLDTRDAETVYGPGRWVRVKFVVVKPKPKKKTKVK